MVKLIVFWRTFAITKNPFAGFLLKQSHQRRSLTFRNGCRYSLTWSQFRYIRDSPGLFSSYRLLQLENDLFKLETIDGPIICNAQLLPLLCALLQDYTITQEKPNLFHLRNQKVDLLGSSDMLVCILEQKTGEYDVDFRDKIVLDVGGFEGESAAYFWQKGARKIIVYEPLTEHLEYIKRNVTLNNINAEIHQTGIGKEDGKIKIYYDRIDPGFGIHSKGENSIEITLNNISKVIKESGANVAKFDCEGAEESLIDVSEEILQRIPLYIIEVHSSKLRKDIINKFEASGFILRKEVPKVSDFSVLVFELSPD